MARIRSSTGADDCARDDAARALMIANARMGRRRGLMGTDVVARMSRATCGTAGVETPGCRCAHPGYARWRSSLMCPRHCERSEAIHSFLMRGDGLLRCARNDGTRAYLLPHPFFRSKNALN